MTRPGLLAALALVDYAVYRGLVWLHDATELTQLDHGLFVQVAFAVVGLIILVVTPWCGWRVARKTEPSDRLPRARIVG